MQQTSITNSSEETQKLGINFAKQLKAGDVLALHGDLGSGKTTFVQGIAKGLGINNKVISPTFIVIRQHEISSQKNLQYLYHVDLYRLEDEKDIAGLGVTEIISDSSNITAIEWPEKMGKLLPKKRYNIFFENLDTSKRKITIK